MPVLCGLVYKIGSHLKIQIPFLGYTENFQYVCTPLKTAGRYFEHTSDQVINYKILLAQFEFSTYTEWLQEYFTPSK